MKSLKRKTTAVPKKAPGFRMTRAWVVGYFEGRHSTGAALTCPYERTQEKNDWAAGKFEGEVQKSFQNRVKHDDVKVNHEVLKIRRTIGEKV